MRKTFICIFVAVISINPYSNSQTFPKLLSILAVLFDYQDVFTMFVHMVCYQNNRNISWYGSRFVDNATLFGQTRQPDSTMLLWLVFLIFVGGTASRSQECQECELTVDLLHRKWGDETTETCIGELAVFVCESFQIEDNFICNGIIGDFRDEFDYILGQIIVEPHQICGLLMKDCGSFIDPFNATWHLPMPPNQPKPVDKQAVPPGKPQLRVLHLTDLHLDMSYTPGEETNCGTPQCCRPQSDPNELSSTSQRDVKLPAGQWGMLGNCDAPYPLFVNMLQDIQKTQPNLDYVVVSGDLMSHADWDYKKTTHAAMIKNVSDTIRSHLPNIPVYFAVGNHEGVPIDNIAPHSVPREYHMDWLYESMADAWHGWVPEDQHKTLKYNGCYMVNPYPGLRIISLNNVFGDSNNFWMYINQTDPDGSMTWLIEQLTDAENAGDAVHIISHVTGSNGESFEGWAINYYNVVNRFQNTIVAQFFGHTHSERFYMIYENPEDSTSRPTSVVYSAPSLTTYSAFFPAYRVYTIDGNYPGSSYQVMDFEERFFNLTENNASPSNPIWKTLYSSANAVYGLKSQTPAEWNGLIGRMAKNQTLFDTYRQNYYRRTSYDGLNGCDENCRLGFLCDCKQFHHSDKLCPEKAASFPKTAARYRRTTMSRLKERMRNSINIRTDDKCAI